MNGLKIFLGAVHMKVGNGDQLGGTGVPPVVSIYAMLAKLCNGLIRLCTGETPIVRRLCTGEDAYAPKHR